MNKVWSVAMTVGFGLFAGGVITIAWDRIPVWRSMPLADFRTSFAQTLRRVDRLQPALLTISLVSAIGFAATASGTARTLAVLAAAGSVIVLVGSIVLLVPIQRTLASGSELPDPGADRMRDRWLRGHLVRTVAGLGLSLLAAVAAAQ